MDDREKRIEKRIQQKDRREDSRQTSITVSWAANVSAQTLGAGMGNAITVEALEARMREILALYDKLVDERSGVPAEGEEKAL